MKIIAIGAVTAGGKTTVVKSLIDRMPNAISLHFDDYSFEGEVDDFHQWVLDGADYNVWNLEPFKNDIDKIIESKQYDYLFLDYPFAYKNEMIKEYIDCAIFIDTPLDIAMARRVLRDMSKASAEEIRSEMEIYLKYARIAYIQMLKDIKPISDYVIDGSRDLETIVEEVIVLSNKIVTEKDIESERGKVYSYNTEHLMIRQFEIEDANRLYDNHMEEKVKKWFPNECYADINEAKGAIEFYRDCIDKNSLPFVLAVLLKETGELIGDTGVSEVEGRENEVEIGYQISDKYCGKGYATELVNAMTQFAFEHMRAEVIHGRVVHGNGASARVLEKCGYTFVNEEFGAEDDPYGNGMLVYKKVKKGSELSGL